MQMQRFCKNVIKYSSVLAKCYLHRGINMRLNIGKNVAICGLQELEILYLLRIQRPNKFIPTYLQYDNAGKTFAKSSNPLKTHKKHWRGKWKSIKGKSSPIKPIHKP